MTDRHALVSVIIPTYNSGAFISQAVRSVLDQTYRRYEVIVIDDGSTDGTRDILCEFDAHINYLYQENRGPSAARNAGIKAARGEYISFLDADDIWLPDKLEHQVHFIQQNRDLGLVFSDEEAFDGERVLYRSLLANTLFYSAITSQKPIREAFSKLMIENFIPTSTVMVRSKCFKKAGLFDESLQVSEDGEMWSRIAAYFGIGCLTQILGRKRVHQSNISSNAELTLQCRIRVWEKARSLFPSLAPASILNTLLANTYLQLGYMLLARDVRKEARLAAVKSLNYAARSIAGKKFAENVLPSYQWALGFGLILFTFLGRQVTQSLWQVKNILIKRNNQPV